MTTISNYILGQSGSTRERHAPANITTDAATPSVPDDYAGRAQGMRARKAGSVRQSGLVGALKRAGLVLSAVAVLGAGVMAHPTAASAHDVWHHRGAVVRVNPGRAIVNGMLFGFGERLVNPGYVYVTPPPAVVYAPPPQPMAPGCDGYYHPVLPDGSFYDNSGHYMLSVNAWNQCVRTNIYP